MTERKCPICGGSATHRKKDRFQKVFHRYECYECGFSPEPENGFIGWVLSEQNARAIWENAESK